MSKKIDIVQKYEIRISKSETNSNVQNTNVQTRKIILIVAQVFRPENVLKPEGLSYAIKFILNFGHLDFDFVSNFGFCASNFTLILHKPQLPFQSNDLNNPIHYHTKPKL